MTTLQNFSLKDFINSYSSTDKDKKYINLLVNNITDNDNVNYIEEFLLTLEKIERNSPKNFSSIKKYIEPIVEKLVKTLKLNDYKITYSDVNLIIETKHLLEKNKNNIVIYYLNENNLIDDLFCDHLISYINNNDKMYMYKNIETCSKLMSINKTLVDKFLYNLTSKLDNNDLVDIIFDIKENLYEDSFVLKWIMKKIKDIDRLFIDYLKKNIYSKNTKLSFFLYSLEILDKNGFNSLIKELINICDDKNNEIILENLFIKILPKYHLTEEVYDIILTVLFDTYNISYKDCIIFFYTYKNLDVNIKKIIFLKVTNPTIPTKEELKLLINQDIDFSTYYNRITDYDPDEYTLYIKNNKDANFDNDDTYKKWIKDWYIPHSKLKDDDFFTFSEQEQSCYLKDKKLFKVENTSLGVVNVDVLKYNISTLSGDEFKIIYSIAHKPYNSLSKYEKDYAKKHKENITINLNFTNSEITNYHTELRKLDNYKKYIEEQALFINNLSLYEYTIIFSHFTAFFNYSTKYIINRGNLESPLPLLPPLFELIVKVCNENNINTDINDLLSIDKNKNISHLLSQKFKNIDEKEIQDLSINISKKIMERYYIDFNEIFQKAPIIEDDIVIYRGVRDIYWSNELSKDKFLALTIQSTTLIPHIPGYKFDIISGYTAISKEGNKESCCLKRIVLKKGCRSIFIQLLEPTGRELNQIIIPANSIYTVKKVHNKLMIPDVNEDINCNNQQHFIKTFDMEVLQTLAYPSTEETISKFCKYFKDWMYANDSQWIVKGGYGLKKVIEHRYKKKDVIKTDDIDISILFSKNDEDKIKEYKDNLMKTFNDFVYSTGIPYLFSYITPRYIGEKELKWILQFNYLGKEWIDISLVYSQINYVEIDKLVSDHIELPVKTIKGYAEDYIQILKEENIKGIDDRTYKKRNPITGFLAIKGRKDIQRTKDMCYIEDVSNYYPNLCNYLTSHTIKDFMTLSEKELTILLN